MLPLESHQHFKAVKADAFASRKRGRYASAFTVGALSHDRDGATGRALSGSSWPFPPATHA